jgi:anti-sigma factor RsiW
MSCTSHDWKGYFLGELPDEDRRPAEEHLGSCPDCREELERLRLTRAALETLEDEAIPQRIAFVSDRVFEPRWWQRSPQWAMLAAGVLAVAILVHAFAYRPVRSGPGVDMAAVQTRIESEVARRVAASEQRQQAVLREAVAEVEKKSEFDRRTDQVAMQETFEYMQKRMGVVVLASNERGGAR